MSAGFPVPVGAPGTMGDELLALLPASAGSGPGAGDGKFVEAGGWAGNCARLPQVALGCHPLGGMALGSCLGPPPA